MHWKRTLFTFGAAVIGIAVLASYWYLEVRTVEDEAVEAAPAEVARIDQPFVTIVDPSKGPIDAKVTVVEFGDHACPYCRSSQTAVDKLLAEHPKEVRFVWKSAPSPLHLGAEDAAQAALCAERQGKFWEYHAALFENSNLFDQTSLAILASDLDLDTSQFNECLVQDQTRPIVEKTVVEARALGLTSIPTLFINGVRHEGALSYDQLLEASGL